MRAIVTFGYVGLIPFASGTWGYLAAIPVAYAFHFIGGFPLLLVATVVAAVVGWYGTRVMTAEDPTQDPSYVVIDEVAGQWIALWPLSAGLWFAGAAPHVFPWPGWVAAFFLFRLFDIWKPGPIGWADRLKSPLGVMLDDLIAGAFTAVCVGVMAWVSHGLLGI